MLHVNRGGLLLDPFRHYESAFCSGLSYLARIHLFFCRKYGIEIYEILYPLFKRSFLARAFDE